MQNEQLAYKVNIKFFAKGLLVSFFTSLLFIFVLIISRNDDIGFWMTTLFIVCLIIMLWTFSYYFKFFFYFKKALIFNQTGLEYFGKHIINWDQISSGRIRRQASEQSENISSKVVSVIAALASMLSPSASAGAYAGGSGSMEAVRETLVLAFTLKDPKQYLASCGLLKRSVVNINSAIEENDKELVFVPIKPLLNVEISQVANDLKKYGIDAKIDI